MGELTAERIAVAPEWEIRSIVSREKFTVCGKYKDIMNTAQLADRSPRAQDKRYTNHPILGEILADTSSRMEMTICRMAAKINMEAELLVEGISPNMDWLCLPSDKDKLLIVTAIVRFLDHQEAVHRNNFSKPSKEELADYRSLVLIHNHVLEGAEDWINRIPYDIKGRNSDDFDRILNNGLGGNVLGNEEDDNRVTIPKLGEVMSGTGIDAYGQLSSNWG